jgi:alpha-ribazole phosphatase
VVSHGGPLRLLGPMLRGEAPDLLAPAPAMGRIESLRIG